MALWALGSYADKLPKGVEKARQSVASVVTYKNGVMLHNGTAVFVGEKGEFLSARSLFVGADSAVVIDNKGVARSVKYIVGVNEMFDCVRARVVADKKLKALSVSAAPVVKGETLFQLGYGVGKGGFVEPADVNRVDSIYSCAYYTLAKPMEQRFSALPLVNGNGEFVAVMQEAAAGDTVNSYAIGASLISKLNVSVPVYGRGYYPSMGIRTALPTTKEDALSCLYMQAIVGDSASYKNVIDDFIALYPNCYEGYMAKAEYDAVLLRDIKAAEQSWNKAFKLAEKPAEVHLGKAKALNNVLLEGDSVSHPMLALENVLAEIDQAIALDSQSLFINAKAEILCSHGHLTAAAMCYESLSSTGAYEASYIASEILAGFAVLRCRGIFSTHLHELAASISEINLRSEERGGVKIDTLVAGIEEGKRSFKIHRAKPDGKSYARDIANKYGLSFDTLMGRAGKGGGAQ